jgi:hypothetical protein
LWRAGVCWPDEADFDDSCLQPLAQCGGAYRQFGQQWSVVNVVKTAADVCIQYPLATVSLTHSSMDSLDGVHGTASWPKSVGIGCKARFPCWLQCCFDNCLHHPVLHGRYPQGSLRAVVLWDIHPTDWFWLVPLEVQALLKQCPPGFGGVAYPPVDACGGFSWVFLCNTSDRQELVGRGSHEEVLEGFNFPPCLVHRGSGDSLLQPSYLRFYAAPTHVSPGVRMACSPFSKTFHCLTSPQVRTWHKFTIVRPKRQSAPLRVGYARVCGPIRPVTGRQSLVPSSHTLCSVPIPYGLDPTCVGSIGLTQLSMEKNMSGTVGVCPPVSLLHVAAPRSPQRSCSRTILVVASQPLWPLVPSRGFRVTLHWRSTFPAFPRPSPRRGWQRSEHCPQSFAPRITRQHVWGGTPGHYRARSGAFSPSSILLHEPYEVRRVCARLPPGRNALKRRGLWLALPAARGNPCLSASSLQDGLPPHPERQGCSRGSW